MAQMDIGAGQTIVSRSELYDSLDAFTESRRAEIDKRSLSKGSTGEIPRVPLITGISATPERFDALIAGTDRIRRPVVVPPEDVRASGLLKETIVLYHPREDQPADVTMLQAATQSWRRYRDHWASYCQAQGEDMVEPVMVVQVQDAPTASKQVSRTDISAAMRTIDNEIGPLPANAFAHAFDEGTRLSFDGHDVRYLDPSDIERDPHVRVVFFKMSLNTGWDCPRAEVMVSFRTAHDATYIAQLVGRMVRTPLARRVDTDEYLNTVALYLPYYDEREVNRVITQLTEDDPNILPPITVKKGEALASLERASDSAAYFERLAHVPSYVIPRSRKASEIRRLMRLGRLLANDNLMADGPEAATNILLDVLWSAYRTAKDTPTFQEVVARTGTLRIEAIAWSVLEQGRTDAEAIEIDLASENVDDLFDAAGRKLGEGLHKAWWKARTGADPSARTTAKLEILALSLDPTVIRQLNTTAQATVQRWLKDYGPAIATLSDARQQDYDEIRQLAVVPEIAPLTYPSTIMMDPGIRTVKGAVCRW